MTIFADGLFSTHDTAAQLACPFQSVLLAVGGIPRNAIGIGYTAFLPRPLHASALAVAAVAVGTLRLLGRIVAGLGTAPFPSPLPPTFAAIAAVAVSTDNRLGRRADTTLISCPSPTAFFAICLVSIRADTSGGCVSTRSFFLTAL